jgi:hypothetical protein
MAEPQLDPPKKKWWWDPGSGPSFLAWVAMVLAIVIAGSLFSYLNRSDTDRPGEPGVIQLIESETDCADLQQEFDDNMGYVEATDPSDPLHDTALAHAEAADDRMQEIGCYG